MDKIEINPTSDRSINKSTVPGATVTDALNTIAAVGAVRNAPAGTMSGTTPDVQLLVSTTPVLIAVFDTAIISDRVTVDTSGAKFTIQDAGRYLIGFNFACAPANNNTVITIGIHVNGSGTATVDIPILARTAGENVGIPFSFAVDGNALDTIDFRISIGSGTQTITFDEASAYIVQQAVGLATLEGAVESTGGMIEAPSDKTYVLDESAAYAYDIDSLIAITDSGSTSVSIEIDGTVVTGISGIFIDSSGDTGTATAANSVAIGQRVTKVFSAGVDPLDYAFTLKTTRT